MGKLVDELVAQRTPCWKCRGREVDAETIRSKSGRGFAVLVRCRGCGIGLYGSVSTEPSALFEEIEGAAGSMFNVDDVKATQLRSPSDAP